MKTGRFKRFLSLTLAVLMVVGILPVSTFAGAPDVGTNWVTNGGFEEGTAWDGATDLSEKKVNGSADGWKRTTGDGIAYLIISDLQKHSGEKCLEIRLPEGNTTKSRALLTYTTTSPLEKGKTYIVSFWAKATNTKIKLECQPQYKESGNPVQSFTLTTDWVYYSYDITPAEGDKLAETFKVQLRNTATTESGSLFVDDVSVVEKAPEVESVTVAPEAIEIAVEETTQLVATVTPAGAAVTWESDDPTKVTVDSEGNITGVAEGTATVTATAGGKSGSCFVTVKPDQTNMTNNLIANGDFSVSTPWDGEGEPAVKKINGTADSWNGFGGSGVGNAYPAITGQGKVGNGLEFVLEGSPAEGESPAVSAYAGVISGKIEAGALKANTTYIISCWAKITVSGLKITPQLRHKNKGNGNLSAAGPDAVGEWQYIAWEITTTDDVGGPSGNGADLQLTVKANATGSVFLDNISVVEKIPATKVELDKNEATLEIGGTLDLVPTVTPAASTDIVKWESSDPAVATVENGKVTAVSAGEATVTVTAGQVSAKCVITVNAREEEQPDGNLITNGNFSDSAPWDGTGEPTYGKPMNGAATGWNIYASTKNAAVIISANGGRNDSECLEIRLDGTDGALGGAAFNHEPLKPDTTYTITYWMKTTNESITVDCRPNYLASGNTTYNSKNCEKFEADDGWVKVVKEFTTKSEGLRGQGENTQTPALQITSKTTDPNGILYIDDISIVEQIPDTKVELDKNEATLEIGGTLDLVATVTPANTADAVVWSSGNESVATVENGKVTAVNAGEAIITVTVGTASAQCVITVNAKEEEQPDGNLITNGNFSASAPFTGDTPVNQSTKPYFNGTATNWSRYNTSGTDGNGIVIISADGGKEGAGLVLSIPADTDDKNTVAGMSWSKTGVNLEVGKTYFISFWAKTTNTNIKIGVLPQIYNGTTNNNLQKTTSLTAANEWQLVTFTYTIADPATLTPTTPGTPGTMRSAMTLVILTGATKEAGEVYIDDVSVVAAIEPTDITLNKTEISLNGGESTKLTATVTPENATMPLQWSSSDETVATVDAQGNVVGMKKGTATVTVTAGNAKAECTVTVLSDGSLAPNGDFELATPWDGTAELEKSDANGKHVNGTLPSGWSVFWGQGEGYVTVSPNGGVDNSQAVQLRIDGKGNRVGLVASTKYIPAEDANLGNKSFIISYWVKAVPSSDTAGDVKFSVQPNFLKTGNANSASTKIQTISTADFGQWIQVVYKVTPTLKEGAEWNPKAMGINIGFASCEFSGDLYFDNFKIEEEGKAQSVSISDSALTLKWGQTKQLTATVTPADAPVLMAWESSNEKVVTVDSKGNLTVTGEGTAVITVSAGGQTATCTVTVVPPDKYPGTVFQDSFENGIPNGNSGILATKTDRVWNGADHTGWKASVSYEGVMLDGISGGAKDGKNCLKITATGGRVMLTYGLTNEQYYNLCDGATYVFKAWVKGSGNFRAVLQPVQLLSGNTSTSVTLTGEWQLVEFRFVADKSSAQSRGYLNLTLGMQSSGTGTLYIDNVSLERIWEPSSITLEKEEYYMGVGSSVNLKYTLKPFDSKSEIKYISSDVNIATVDKNGKITAKKSGEVTVTARTVSGNRSDTCKVYVVENYVPMTDFSVSSLSMTLGSSQPLKVNYSPANATPMKGKYTSDSPKTVSVDENGTLTAIRTGTANITVTIGGISRSFAVTVSADPSYKPQNKTYTVEFGSTSQWDLNAILGGSTYTVLDSDNSSQLKVDGTKLTYIPYIWCKDPYGNLNTMKTQAAYVNATSTEQVVIGVTNAAGKTSTITLNVKVNSLSGLFYDDSGNWITDFDLFMSEEKLAYIRTQITDTNSDYYRSFQNMLSYMVGRFESKPYQYQKPVYSNVTVAYDTDARDVGSQLMNWMMLYLMTKDVPIYQALNKQFLKETIEWTTYLLRYPFWGTLGYQNSDLAAGHNLFACAMAYHYMQDEFKDLKVDQIMGTDGSSEAAYDSTVKTYKDQPMLEALELRLWTAAEDMYEARYDGTNYAGNHQQIQMSGLMAAATTLRQQKNLTASQKNTLMTWATCALSKNGYSMNYLFPDGTSQEGYGYWTYGAEYMMRFATIAQAAFDIDVYHMTDAFKNSTDFILYNLLPEEEITSSQSVLNFSDSPRGQWNGPCQHLRVIAAVYQNPEAQWLAEKVERLNINAMASSTWMGIIYIDDTLEAKEPDADTLHVFEELQIAIGRTGWDGNEQIVAIKCGTPIGTTAKGWINSGEYTGGNYDGGHGHTDAGHTVIYANGEFILWDDGNTVKRTANHNTLLINGKGQMGEGSYTNEVYYQDKETDPYLKIVQETPTYNYIVADATAAYADERYLESYQRNLIWLKEEQVLLVVDNVRMLQEAELEVRWLPEFQNIYYNDGKFIAEGKKNITHMFSFTEGTKTTMGLLDITGQRQRQGFRQTYTGTSWQNAVAFSWDLNENWDLTEDQKDYGVIDADPTHVRYLKGEGSVHQFEVNGKIYIVDVEKNTVSVSTGELDIPETEDAKDSSLSTVKIEDTLLEGFDPAVTEYTVDRWWKVHEFEVEAYTNAYGATVEIKPDYSYPGTTTITCTSRDGTSQTTYTIHTTNSQNLLDIIGAYSNFGTAQETMKLSYDGYLSTSNESGKYWTVMTTEDQTTLKVIFDLGVLSEIERFDLALANSRRRNHVYNVEISLDGKTWTPYITEATFLATEPLLDASTYWRTIFEGQAVQARYVRVEVLGYGEAIRTEGIYLGISEATFYGTQLEKYPEPEVKPDDTDKPEPKPTDPVETQPQKPTDGQQENKLSAGVIVAIVLGAVLVLGGAAVAVYIFVIKPKRAPAPAEETPETVE